MDDYIRYSGGFDDMEENNENHLNKDPLNENHLNESYLKENDGVYSEYEKYNSFESHLQKESEKELNENHIEDHEENSSEDYDANIYNAYGSYLEENSENSHANEEYGHYSSEEHLKESPFYSESYTKPKNKKSPVLMQMIVVAIISSLLGGTVSGFVFTRLSKNPVRPDIESIFSSGDDTAQSATNLDLDKRLESDYYRKVVVESAESPVVAIAEKVGPSVVGISVTSQKLQGDFWFFGTRETTEQGSGIIIRSDGYIMTNNHVIEGALEGSSNEIAQGAKIEVILPNEREKAYPAKVVGRDSKTDLAVLKIEKNNLPVVEFGNSDEVKVGELAVAIGNPGGLEYMGSVTVGVISGLNRTIPIADDRYMKLIQTDASINPGNSGGALVNSKGQLIGVNTAKIGGYDYEGLGFAIPVNKAKEITDSLIEYNYVKGRPLIGIMVETRYTEEVAKRNNLPMGVLVDEVTLYSAAHKAGIKRMDIITKFNGVRVKSLEELNNERDKYKPGDIVTVEIYRDGKTIELELEIGEEKG